MLDFSSFFDAHFHLNSQDLHDFPRNFTGFTCAHTIEEWNEQEKRIDFLCADKDFNRNIYKGFGIHPWNPILENVDFLEMLLKKGKLNGIGETGFDFFTPELKNNKDLQKKCWNIQVELALQYKMPLVIHLRKAIDEIYRDSARLSKLPGVLFHGFSGNLIEAETLLKKIPYASFSFGTVLLKGGKKALECVKFLPPEKVYFETDEAGVECLSEIYKFART